MSATDCGPAGQAGRPEASLTWPGAGHPTRWGGGPLRWFFSGVWLVYLIGPVADLFGPHHHPAWWIACGLVLAAAFCVIYVGVVGSWDLRPQLAQRWLAVLLALAVVACAVYGSDWLPLWIYVSAAAGFIIPGRRTPMLAIVGIAGCYALLSLVEGVSATNFLIMALPVVLIGWAMNGFRMQILLTRELIQAREAVAKLAANEERLRLARDMHDLTGQSLSLITLKSELVRKLLARLPPGGERDAALTEVADIGRVSRQTLHDIRDVVSGYLRPTLAIEIITARTALEPAGIELDDDPGLTLRSGTFDADAEAALAWCLREAVTNVIRHSGARSCQIVLTQPEGEWSVAVSDDGRGFSGPTEPGPARTGPARTGPARIGPARIGPARIGPGAEAGTAGTGLRGMSDRLAAVGGRLSLGPAETGSGFRLVATVPQTPIQAKPQTPTPATPQTPTPATPQTPTPAMPQESVPAGPEAAEPLGRPAPVRPGPQAAGPLEPASLTRSRPAGRP